MVSRRVTLARQILESHYSQPATALWRVFEAEVVLSRLNAEGRGLDLGCGDGELAAVMLTGTNVRWTGLDIDEADAELARKRGFYENVHLASASHIPEPDRAFDVVFSNSSLEHMQELDGVLAEVARVLKPGGQFVFTVPLREFNELLLWRRALSWAHLQGLSERYAAAIDERLAHRNLLTSEAWRDKLGSHGLQIAQLEPYLTSRAIAVWETLSNATGGVAKLLTGKHPREVQRSAGMLRGRSPAAAAVSSILLLPALLLASGNRGRTGALYIEARRR
jgi:SAM-dependent methyltransferase